ncbi:hypothetical protein P691DRAFT_828461 [Macrolepiota fuliginosa MF-IS2]|uniref:arginyltransferase n=1 Tax=Macrolepiota fuliginosa MF-IS2 TaxID=1400762 RepID=A0A9P6C522_9AGAR|nr:hypothetical protein P691DRAFT_828461 [Macrolepiota fuliginosa MF-IS2]
MTSKYITLITNEDEQIKSIGTPFGRSSSTCGYCSPPGERSGAYSSYHVAGLNTTKLTCEVYQKMIDRGWRRSGIWCYKPDLRISCCPQYTVKLDASVYKPSKSQRKIINRWSRYVLKGKEGEMMETGTNQKNPEPKGKEQVFDLVKAIHAAEESFHKEEHPAHRFETSLEPASFTEEKYQLYVRYQRDIHNDLQNTPRGFERFLVTSPLRFEEIPYPSVPPGHLPRKYGSYHQLYRLDGNLIAVAVLDILPCCVSSVYFMYDKAWEEFSLGKLSAMREVSLAREIHEAGISDMRYLYMGFYIESCQKMRYKGEYAPSYLLDPEAYDWHPLESCRPLLQQNRYACFSNPSHSIQADAPKEFIDRKPPRLVDRAILENIRILAQAPSPDLCKYLIPVYRTRLWKHENVREEYEACVEGLGKEVAQKLVFNL